MLYYLVVAKLRQTISQKGEMSLINTKELKVEMIRANVTQEDCANHLGLTPTTFGKKMNNKASFDIDEVISLCSFLNITDNARKSEIFLPSNPEIDTEVVSEQRLPLC